jgi:hypothetical protein
VIFNRLQRLAPRTTARTAAMVLAVSAMGTPASAEDIVAASPTAAVNYEFSADDVALLDAIQRGCFQYMWREVGIGSGLAKDRRTTLVASVGGVGFQLSALPIGVERGWITREQGRERAVSILRTLSRRDDNRRQGVYLHFVHVDTGGIFRT